jgi:amino acid adenylation domain-containing protein
VTESVAPETFEPAGEYFSFPLSFAQRRLWFLEQLEPGSAYNVPLPIRLRGGLDRPALQRALDAVVARHEALRTTFVEEDGTPLQLVHPTGSFELESDDVSLVADPEAEARARVTAEAARPFDLSAGAPRRALLLRLGPEDHVLTLTFHHVVCDGWSLGVLFQELGALYGGFAGGSPADLPELPIQYADYAVRQHEWLQGDVLDEQLDYWRSQLAGAPTVLELPTDRPRPAVQAQGGAHHIQVLPASLLTRVKALAQKEGATLFMTLLAAFEILLARYSRQREFLVGTPAANRNRVELEGLIGFLTNTLVLRASLTPANTFRELLAQVRETVLEAEAHEDLPFELLVEELNPPRDRSRTPLFQVMFSFHTTPGLSEALRLPGITIESFPIERGTNKFDLSLFMRESGDGLRASFEYSTELFDADTIERMAAHLETLLEAIVADPDAPTDELDLLGPAERRRLLTDWNATHMSYPDCRLDELVAAQAAATPDRVAIAVDGAGLTYGELDERANRLAQHLRQLGVAPGKLVGLCLERTLDLHVAALGIWKAGGAYVPLDPGYPAERLRFMLEDSSALVVITQTELLDALPATAAELVCLDRAWPAIAALDARVPDPAAAREDVAVVIYTSGSTGRPKGVETPHCALVNLMSSVQRDLALGADDTFLATTTLSFDIAAVELYLPLICGGTVALAPSGAAADPWALADLLDRHGATVMQATPSGWRLLLDGGWRGRHGLTALTAGEPLARTLADDLLERVDALWNYYGPTETTIYSTGTRVRTGERVTIGRPVANTALYIVDERTQPAPIGVPGELLIGGDGVARGYLGRPELTAERFLPHPFGGGGRVYRTGDVARFLPDGNVDFLGRIDHQVKLRGFRIELEEVENALRLHHAVQAVVVVVREDQPGRQQLVAYVVGEGGAAPDAAELREFLQGTLPAYMIPSAFVPLGALPLGPSGKVDRSALPEPDFGQDTETMVLPRDAVEETLAEIWQDVLGLEGPVGIRDDFFEMGGHSLLAVRLVSLIEQAFGTRIPLATLFEGATIEALAQRVVETRADDTEWPTIVPLRTAGDRPPLFFLHGHDGQLLYFRELVQSLRPDQPAYGVQPVGLDGRAQPFRSLEEMASHYADEIVRFQPEGRHLLVGYCFSGALAYEVARRLEDRGHPPRLLALIDAPPRGQARVTRGQLERRKFKELLEADLRGKARWVGRRARGLIAKVRSRTRVALVGLAARRSRRRAGSSGVMEDVIARALSGYVTQPSALRVTLFRAAPDAERASDRRSDWERLAGSIDLHPIVAPGIAHDNIVRRPYAELLARELEKCADRAVSGPSR